MHRVLAALVVVATFWALWRSVDVFIEMLLERPWAVDNPSARSLVAVTGNFTRVALTIMGLLSTLSAFGLPVTTAVAGLGIGGIALAFGAQKTVADLFGSVAIAADRPCRVGDTVRVEDVVGVVEEIGVRSTRIRTPDRSVVSFPNGRLADMRIETLAVRDRIRFATMVGVVYGTSEQQLKQVLTGLEDVLRRHPHIWKDVITVRFAGFGATALEIEVQCWFNTPDYELLPRLSSGRAVRLPEGHRTGRHRDFVAHAHGAAGRASCQSILRAASARSISRSRISIDRFASTSIDWASS